MKEKKHIDRLFQEKFRDFEIAPHDRVWKNIEKELHAKDKKRRPVFWLWFGGVAAGLALLFYINNPFTTDADVNAPLNTSETKQQENILKTPVVVKSSEITETPDTNLKTNSDKTLQKTVHKSKKVKIPHQILQNSHTETGLNTNKKPFIKAGLLPNKHSAVTELSEFEKTMPLSKKGTNYTDKTRGNEVLKPENTSGQTIADNNKQKSKNELEPSELALENSKKTTIETKPKKWSVSTFAAPVYLNSFDKNKSSIDKQFDNNTKQGSFSSAYGVQLAYQFSDKFSLQSGVHLVDYGYKTYDIYVSPMGAVNHYANINYNSDADLVAVYAAPSNSQDLAETNLRARKGNILQVYGYVEIPLELKYRLNKGDFDINLIGGFSTLLLNKNQIFIESDGLSSKLGEASNLNSLNFSGNFGLEFDYKLYQNLHFNLVPMFKVQTNTFEKNTGGFNPYAIGVYSGLNLRF